MFFVIPSIILNSRLIILIAAAVIPAIFLLVRIYKEDRLEPEPKGNIIHLLVMGIFSTFLAVMMERVGSAVLGLLSNIFNMSETVYNIILYFIVVGVSEELAKFALLDRETWRSPYFDCKFDGVVYAVTIALGFALWENIEYVLSYGFRTALVRAVTAVPGHACFGVIMGFWYGLAKRCELRNDLQTCKTSRILCVAMSAFIHGCYDYIATLTSAGSTWIFVGFVAVMFLISLFVIRRLARNDSYL